MDIEAFVSSALESAWKQACITSYGYQVNIGDDDIPEDVKKSVAAMLPGFVLAGYVFITTSIESVDEDDESEFATTPTKLKTGLACFETTLDVARFALSRMNLAVEVGPCKVEDLRFRGTLLIKDSLEPALKRIQTLEERKRPGAEVTLKFWGRHETLEHNLEAPFQTLGITVKSDGPYKVSPSHGDPLNRIIIESPAMDVITGTITLKKKILSRTFTEPTQRWVLEHELNKPLHDLEATVDVVAGDNTSWFIDAANTNKNVLAIVFTGAPSRGTLSAQPLKKARQ